jgi:hypothetical protein
MANNVITTSNGTMVTIYDNGATKSVIGADGIWHNLLVSKSDKSLDDPDARRISCNYERRILTNE